MGRINTLLCHNREVTLSSTVVVMVVAMLVAMGEARGKGVFNSTLQWNTMVIKTGFYCLTKDLVHKVET